MTTIIIATVFLASVIGFGLLMKHLRDQGFKTKESPIKPPPPPKQEDPEVEFKAILDNLLKLNLMIRKDRHFPKPLILNIEQIIDDLKAVIPAMMERYSGETLTYELKKIGRTHLSKTVKEYLDLSLESREIQKAAFEKTVTNLHNVCHRSREIVEKNETAEFKTMAHFLEGKFS
ncbi:MAG: hypothetical protein MI892_29710 [Desulfobacterales bacterium]|nr:hypothetical protein [Desulfobacterales bacterium]